MPAPLKSTWPPATFVKMPRLKYNDMVLLKWMLTLFIQHSKNHSTMKLVAGDQTMNWPLMAELLEEESKNFMEGNRESIHVLLQDYTPQLTTDTFIIFIQLSKHIIFDALSELDKTRDNPLSQIVSDFINRFQNSRVLYSAFPDWWLN